MLDNASEFAGLPIEDYSPDKGIENPTGMAYRLRLDWEEYDQEKSLSGRLQTFLNDEKVTEAPALVIGDWGGAGEGNNSAVVVEMIAAAHERLRSLRHLFIGDMGYEECEISWIQQSNLGALWRMFPDLVELRVRGGEGLSLGDATHEKLQTLIIEAGGLPRSVVGEVARGHLPSLRHLELWLGTPEYGGDATVEDVAPILEGSRFPKVQYLGLRDSEIADSIAHAVATAPITRQLKVLDLSLGTLGDAGGEALLKSDQLGGLDRLDLHHHYLLDGMVQSLRQRMEELGVALDVSDRAEEYGDGDRYVAVSE